MASKTHRYRGYTILPCERRDSIDAGYRWYVRVRHSSGMWYGEEHSPRSVTLADARLDAEDCCRADRIREEARSEDAEGTLGGGKEATMKRYRISNRASGRLMGSYEGDTKEDALLSLHRDAGYKEHDVRIVDGELVFADDDTERLLGGPGAWIVEEEE
jgi:hypothetical protein